MATQESCYLHGLFLGFGACLACTYLKGEPIQTLDHHTWQWHRTACKIRCLELWWQLKSRPRRKSEWIWSSSLPRPRHSWKTWRTRSCSSWALPQARKAKHRSFFSEADLVVKEKCVVLHSDSTSDVFLLVGNILDDEELIETLSSSKIMGTKIEEQVKQQEITAVQIAEVRQVYKCFSCRRSIQNSFQVSSPKIPGRCTPWQCWPIMTYSKFWLVFIN